MRFATGMVHPCLSANRRIHLRKQGRRHLYECDTALVTGRGESGHVTDHAAAQRHHAGIACESVGDQHIEHPRDVRQCFVDFAVRQRHLDATPGRQRCREPGGIQRPDSCVRDQQDVASRDGAGEFIRKCHRAGADEDRITASPKSDFDALHAQVHVCRPWRPRKRSICGLNPWLARP